MHEHIRSFKQNPTQKFHQNFINFEKPPKFQEIPKIQTRKPIHQANQN